MKKKEKEKRIDLFVINKKGTKCPSYWEDGWVIGSDTSVDCVLFARITSPKPGQVIGYREERFYPTPNTVMEYLMDQVDRTSRKWTLEGVLLVIDEMFNRFIEHCGKASAAVAAQPDIHPVNLVIRNLELGRLWAKFALEEQALFKDLTEEIWKRTNEVQR